MQEEYDKLTSDIYQDYVEDVALEPKRKHLGASGLGEKCLRNIWYDFRWYFDGFKEGRILRLFETGKLEERRIVRNLRRRNFIIETHVKNETTGEIDQIECRDGSGHIGGSVDGIIHHLPVVYGILDTDKIVLESKTHSEKNFRKLKPGVKIGFPKHYTQMQVYMGLMEIAFSLYVGVNKNTDEMYFETVPFDKPEFDSAYAVAKTVVVSDSPPMRIRENPSWFECKMCKFHDICHMQAPIPVNCRTCINSRPINGGRWTCDLQNREISYDEQIAACGSYKVNN